MFSVIKLIFGRDILYIQACVVPSFDVVMYVLRASMILESYINLIELIRICRNCKENIIRLLTLKFEKIKGLKKFYFLHLKKLRA